MSLSDIAVAVPHALYLASILLFSVYGINFYVLTVLHYRAKHRMLRHDDDVWRSWRASEHVLPRVTVQLPVYNERYVVERIIDAVVRLDYPRDKLEIQVLDDSTDETTEIAGALIERYRRSGIDITLHHRTNRAGYKAGALREGHQVATGEFIAIFDADFVPDPDFLSKTLPFFQDPDIAVVQTRWGHINRNYSLLTLAQSIGLDGHFYVEQSARCWSGYFLNFNGTGGVWRKAAIDDAGGWQGDTLTEDLDLSYRAQLKGWRFKFLPQVVCPGEIPAQMLGAKNQQHRWAKGTAQTAIKLLPRIVTADLPLVTKLQAIFHLTNYMVHPLMLVITLSSPLLLEFQDELTADERFLLTLSPFFSIAMLGPLVMYLYAQRELYPDWKRRLALLPALLAFVSGLTFNNTKAVFEAFLNVDSAFVRTPKFRLEARTDSWLGKRYHSPLTWVIVVEALLALYCLYGVYLFLQYRGWYEINPFFIVFTIGFATVAMMSLWETASNAVVNARPIKATLEGERGILSLDPGPDRTVVVLTSPQPASAKSPERIASPEIVGS